jgi:hypothetical protein
MLPATAMCLGDFLAAIYWGRMQTEWTGKIVNARLLRGAFYTALRKIIFHLNAFLFL